MPKAFERRHRPQLAAREENLIFYSPANGFVAYNVPVWRSKALSVLAAGFVLSATGAAGTLSIGSLVVPSSPSRTIPLCATEASGNRPSTSDHLSFGYKLLVSYTGTDADDSPPTTVALAFDANLSGSYDYVL